MQLLETLVKNQVAPDRCLLAAEKADVSRCGSGFAGASPGFPAPFDRIGK
jgi:hypothetical protein